MSAPFETPTADELRRRGSAKWTAFPGAIGAFVAEMDFGVAPPVGDVLHEAVTLGRFGYTPKAAIDDVAAATAAFATERYDWPIAAEQVRTVGDVLSGYEIVLRHFSDPGRPVIVPTPAYMPFLTTRARWGRDVIEVPSPEVDGRTVLDLEGIARAFAAGADVLVLCNPWNPVGRVLTRDELVAVSAIVEEHGGRVFSDEIHAPLVLGDHRHVPYATVSAAAAAHTVTAISASKAFNLPGLKAAQLVLNGEDAARFDRVAAAAVHGAGLLGVLANTAAYRDGGPWLDAVRVYLAGNAAHVGERLHAGLPQVGYREPEGTYIGWLDLRPLGLGDGLATTVLERAGVALTDGAACGEAGAGFARIILATPRPILQEAVDRIVTAFA